MSNLKNDNNVCCKHPVSVNDISTMLFYSNKCIDIFLLHLKVIFLFFHSELNKNIQKKQNEYRWEFQ